MANVADIVMTDTLIVVKGDLSLDSSDRRLSPNGIRRALVHDLNDRLTINYDCDYPNGVQIRGNLVVDGLFVKGNAGFAGQITTPDLLLGAAAEPPVVRPGEVPSGASTWGVTPVDVKEVIQELQSQIQKLQKRIAALEGKPHS